MINVPCESVILSKSEYIVLLNDAKSRREQMLTREEKDAIIYAIRKLKVVDFMSESSEERSRFINSLNNVAKKLEGYHGDI